MAEDGVTNQILNCQPKGKRSIGRSRKIGIDMRPQQAIAYNMSEEELKHKYCFFVRCLYHCVYCYFQSRGQVRELLKSMY